jgi:hypothetical protein
MGLRRPRPRAQHTRELVQREHVVTLADALAIITRVYQNRTVPWNLHPSLAHRCTRGLSVRTISNHLPEEDKCGVRKTRLTWLVCIYASTSASAGCVGRQNVCSSAPVSYLCSVGFPTVSVKVAYILSNLVLSKIVTRSEVFDRDCADSGRTFLLKTVNRGGVVNTAVNADSEQR